MMNTLLKNQIETRLQSLAAPDPSKTLVVLKGIPLEAVDPEAAASFSLEKVLENRFTWFAGIVTGNRKFITFEEYQLLAHFVVAQYDTVLILRNNLWMNRLPLNLACSPEHIRGLLNRSLESDTEEEDDLEICLNPDLNRLFHGVQQFGDVVQQFGDVFLGTYLEDDLPVSEKIVTEDLFPKAEQPLPVLESADRYADLHSEDDYISLLLSLRDPAETLAVRTASWPEEDLPALTDRLQMLSAYGVASLFLLKEKTVVAPARHREEYTEILRKYWNKNASFREIPVYDMAKLKEGQKEVVKVSQESIISDLVEQVENCANPGRPFRDVFVTASTGSGKSAMFQIPAIYLAEKYNLMTIVVSPLISLMNDQIIGLEKRGYTKAKTLNSDISPIIKEEIRQKVAAGEIHILYLSPETLLARSDVEQLIGDRTIGMIVVDEAHIVTTWGKQFRPDYWYLGDHIKKLRKRQQDRKGRSFVISTFTATAIYRGPEDMYQETVNSLNLLNPITYLGYMKRDDINIVIEKDRQDRGSRKEYEPDKFRTIEDIIQRAVITGRKTLIYFPTVRLIKSCFEQLWTDHLTSAVCTYHGSLSKDEKQENYEKFRTGQKLVMLATKAFGMGVDIPDIELVGHFAPTGNVCDYVQEIGRAARDPQLQGEAYYQYNTHDFKHINTLHGLSKIQDYQLTEVVRKIVELYDIHLKTYGNNRTRKRNAMLLDAENFSYIFQSPLDDPQDDSINKVKTALLLIQKDLGLHDTYPALTVRPIPLFSKGYFQVEPLTQQRLIREYGDCLQELDPRLHICVLNLERIWNASPANRKFSFPQFKYFLYSHDDRLEMTRNHTLIPALSVSMQEKAEGKENYDRIISALKAFINRKAIDNKHVSVEEMARALCEQCSHLSLFKAETICEVVVASMLTWKQNYAKTMYPAILTHPDSAGHTKYSFNVSVTSYFNWLEQICRTIREDRTVVEKVKDGTETSELYLVSDGGTLIQETANVLGVLDALGALSSRMIGGANSQIYIYINQIQTLRNIAKYPNRYKNSLLNLVAQRHLYSVHMLTYLYENDFTSQQRWDLLEDYFLGKIPPEVEKAVQKDMAKKAKSKAGGE